MVFTFGAGFSTGNIQRQMMITQFQMLTSTERLASGFRINRGADDPSGLAISERMRAQIRGAQQGIANAQQGVSMIQTADGSLTETTSILQRMRELAVDAGDGTLSADERTAIGTELVSLRDEIDNIAGRTTFNGNALLTGAFNISTASTIGPIADGGDADTVNVGINVRVADANETYNVTVVGTDVTLTAAGSGATQTITVADLSGDGASATLNFDLLGVELNLTAVQGGGGDGDISAADIAAGLNGSSVVTTGDSADVSFRVGSDVGDDIGVSFSGQILARSIGSGGGANIAELVRDDQAVATVGEANTLLDSIDAALDQVTSEQARLGGSQNQFDFAINSQTSRVTNLTAAESRIRDTDVAAETVRLAALTIQYEAQISLLAQSNLYNESLLRLLE
jgi:flagellin